MGWLLNADKWWLDKVGDGELGDDKHCNMLGYTRFWLPPLPPLLALCVGELFEGLNSKRLSTSPNTNTNSRRHISCRTREAVSRRIEMLHSDG